MVMVLKAAERYCSRPQFQQLCYCLQLESIAEHPGLVGWTPAVGRAETLANVLPELEAALGGGPEGRATRTVRRGILEEVWRAGCIALHDGGVPASPSGSARSRSSGAMDRSHRAGSSSAAGRVSRLEEDQAGGGRAAAASGGIALGSQRVSNGSHARLGIGMRAGDRGGVDGWLGAGEAGDEDGGLDWDPAGNREDGARSPRLSATLRQSLAEQAASESGVAGGLRGSMDSM